MGVDGGNFSCTRCHTTYEHHISGRVYTIPALEKRKSLIEDDKVSQIACISCHSLTPHKGHDKLNDHTDRVACQTCHIPLLAKEKPTKIWWDWSKAGKKKDGKPYRVKDEFGKFKYMSHKGEMKWAKNVMPEYFWYNGTIDGISAGEKIDPTKIVQVSKPIGDSNDIKSLIHPFKVHRGKQPYDTVHNTLLTPLLTGDTGYWGTFNWDKAFKGGAKTMGTLYSGKYDFVETSYVYPSTHMVAPKEDSLKCIECHNNQGRLRNIAGVYMPGRDKNTVVEVLGWLAIILSLLGVVTHVTFRIITSVKRKKNKKD